MVCNKDYQSLHQLWVIRSVSDHIDGPHSTASPPPPPSPNPPPPKLGKEKQALELKKYLSVLCFIAAASITAMTPAKLLCQSLLHCELQKPFFFLRKYSWFSFSLIFRKLWPLSSCSLHASCLNLRVCTYCSFDEQAMLCGVHIALSASEKIFVYIHYKQSL